MRSVCAVVDWRGRADDLVLRRILGSAASATSVHALVLGPCGMGRTVSPPLYDRHRDLAVIADARLDNRAALALELGLDATGPPRTDDELLLLGYDRWGTQLASHLLGDFAFAIWDAARHRLYAARDPFGVRPLCYFDGGSDGLVLASDASSILEADRVPREVEDETVCDYLTDDLQRRRETFVRGVHRVLPGHHLVATEDRVSQERHFFPPRDEVRLKGSTEYAREFGRLFESAVMARLDSDAPIVAHLSGGLDSSSIVAIADRIYERGGRARPALHLASAVYSGLDCDETPRIDRIARAVRFPSERWDGTEAEGDVASACALAHPWRLLQAPGDLRLARRIGGRVVLSGFGGDQLLFERGVFRDLAARGRWLALLREVRLAPGYSSRSASFFLADALRGALPPALRRAYRRLRPRRRPPPAWAGPRLIDVWASRPQAADDPYAPAGSHVHRATWGWLTDGRMCWSTEVQQLFARRAGVEMRFPYLDARLAGFVLAIPYEHRVPGGRMKLLLRESMRGILPIEVVDPRGVTTVDSSMRPLMMRVLPRLEAAFSDAHPWRSAPYVKRSAALEALDTVRAAAVGGSTRLDVRQASFAWAVAGLEAWLRRLKGSGS